MTRKQLIAASDVYLLFRPNGTASLHVADIDVIPRVDAEEVVRCKNCVFWKRHKKVDKFYGACFRNRITKHENGYCDRGERRTDETD